MFQYLTWEEIKKKYPNMWVSIIEPKYSEKDELIGGFFLGANIKKEKLINEWKKLSDETDYKVHAFEYTGNISDTPYIMGLNTIEFENERAKI